MAGHEILQFAIIVYSSVIFQAAFVYKYELMLDTLKARGYVLRVKRTSPTWTREYPYKQYFIRSFKEEHGMTLL